MPERRGGCCTTDPSKRTLLDAHGNAEVVRKVLENERKLGRGLHALPVVSAEA